MINISNLQVEMFASNLNSHPCIVEENEFSATSKK